MSVASDFEWPRPPEGGYVAEAGIPHLWRIENDGGRPVANVYEIDPLSAPFPLDIDFADIDKRRL